MNLEKQRGAKNTIKKLIVDNKEIIDQTHILEYIREFYETLFKKRKQKTVVEIKMFLRQLNISKLPEGKSNLCEENSKDRDKRFIKNWGPISLLNVDLKIISKALSEKLKKVLPDLISSQQTAYVKN